MRLPVQLQRVMAAEAEAAREARAKVSSLCLSFPLLMSCIIILYHCPYQCPYVAPLNVELMLQVIAAQGEQKASQALKMASEVISESSGALQLRYLQARDPLVNIFRVSLLI